MEFQIINMKAPLFCLLDENNKEHCLTDYKGQWILLYFYPKDDTPGCTQEACLIRDSWAEFKNYNAIVLGVSGDSIESHKKFKEKYNLPFPLLSDPGREVMKSMNVLGEKSMFGKKFIGIKRESFLIDPEGVIFKHYKNVKPAIHAEEVLRDLEAAIKNT